MKRRSAGAVAGLVVASLALPAPAHASAGRCADPAAITVVVDPGSLGEQVQVGCATARTVTPAAEAVQEAGFELTYADGQPFLCRIDGRPDAEHESCARTPPGDAYWGLFWSNGKSREWSYSTVGITGLQIPPGGSVGLRFQDGGTRDDPSLPPRATSAGTPELTASASQPRAAAVDDPGNGNALSWAAGAVVVALTAAALALAHRRRRG